MSSSLDFFQIHRIKFLLGFGCVLSWIIVLYVQTGAERVLMKANTTDEQWDAYNKLSTMPYVLFLGGVMGGWICGTWYGEEKAAEKVKSPR
jgi:hypothetical protein